MKRITEEIYSVTNAFYDYLQDSDSKRLLVRLKLIEMRNRKEPNQRLWFKFSKDGTGANIRELVTDLERPNSPNKALRLEQLKECCGLYGEVNVFCS